MLDKLLSNTYFLIFVLLISASLGWLFDLKNKHYTKIINPTSVLALDTIIGFVFFIHRTAHSMCMNMKMHA